MMDRREGAALDRHITGNYGEDQFRNATDWPIDGPGHEDDTSDYGMHDWEPHAKGRDCARTEEVLENYRRRAVCAEMKLAEIERRDRQPDDQ